MGGLLLKVRSGGPEVRLVWLLKFGTSLLVMAVFAVAAACWAWLPGLYGRLVGWLFDVHHQAPFEDLADVLRAGACWRQGVDVYRPSACLGGGVYNYSPFLLRFAWMGGVLAGRLMGGVALALMFCASLALLPPAQTMADWWVRVLACLSGAVGYAVEQGNLDLGLFALVVLALWLAARGGGRGLLFYPLVLLAGAAKFYPAVLLALALREGLKKFLWLAGLLALCGLVFLARFGGGVLAALAVLPLCQPFKATFGAVDLPLGLAMLHLVPYSGARHFIGVYYPIASVLAAQRHVSVVVALLLGACLLRAAFLRNRYTAMQVLLEGERLLFLLAGALVVTLCFFMAQNVAYRAVYLLLTLPALYQMAGDARAKWLLVSVLVLLWEAALRGLWQDVSFALLPVALAEACAVLFWLARELLWWWLIVQFMAMIMQFVETEMRRLFAARGEILSGR